jgi:hypothetical protein
MTWRLGDGIAIAQKGSFASGLGFLLGAYKFFIDIFSFGRVVH